jgi:hypothetical protein
MTLREKAEKQKLDVDAHLVKLRQQASVLTQQLAQTNAQIQVFEADQKEWAEALSKPRKGK